MRRRTAVLVAAAALIAAAAPAAARLPRGSEPVVLDPAAMSVHIDNPYWPMRPGTRWTYRETDPDGTRIRDVVTVTHRTRLVANGVTARVVHDVATEDGAPVEVTDDLYAQDRAGNVWYLGERTAEYEHGRVISREGSFEAGVDGAQAGVVVPAHPVPGLAYRQEWYAGHAEDQASVVSIDEQVAVPAGHYRRVLFTRETNPLEPRVVEYKCLARGVGPVLAIEISGGAGREELLRMHREA